MADLPAANATSERKTRLGGALSLAASLLWIAQAAIIAAVLSALLTGQDSRGWVMALAFLALGLARAVLNRLALATLAAAAETRLQALRHEIIGTESASADASAFGGAGAIAALTSDKLEALRPFLLRYQPARLRVMIAPLVILAITAWVSWAAAVVLLAAGPLIPVFMALVGWAAKEASARQMVEIGSLNDLLADRLAALSDLRLVGAGPQVIDGFAKASESLRQRTMAVLRIAFLSSTVLELFSALGVAMIAVWVGFALLGELSWGTWGTALTPFRGIFLLLLAPDFFQPLRDLAAAWHDKSAADAVMAELADWRSGDRRAVLGTGASADALRFGGLSLTGLQADQGGRTLRFPDLDLRPGDSLALCGPSGAGKTTLLRLIAGLVPPSGGAIRLGRDLLTQDNADAWRACLGWMPQTPRFLGRSLRHNIGFGQALDSAILVQSRVAPIIETLPAGDRTPLGETGAGLSGGEARRVMLARALHRRPGLLLADEPTADLDAETAQDIIDGLLAYVAQGGTLIVATHDPRLMARMDRQMTLEARP
ncbi:thiol reductant ABC exporter subunit CydD [Tropicibacter oceani]|uniref:Thiol reductant ABC exporter subunit CydD n=1 Tax=Tropicibacter oceani TaxID=3058420 RepID=A0ABY8QGD3_9RHOB|nr:thiol reductant ABC exporter subunit CydD [Tropicibacter oceani]WGW02862.1 thiol reductant ABC exporter subunit CydD [Tropicibacter oceani]